MTNPDLSQLHGAPVTNQDDEELGKVTGLLVDDQLGVPTWVVVESGLFGTHHTLVPLAESRVIGGELLVPYTKDDLRSAPHHDPDVALTVKDEQLLFDHYNVGYGTADTTGPHTGVDVSSTGLDEVHAGAHPIDPADLPPDPGLVALPRLRPYAN